MKAKKNKDLENELINDLLEDGDETVRLHESTVMPIPRHSAKMQSGQQSGARSSSVDIALVHSENLRIAQQRILELEGETERLRNEAEQLAAAGETMRKRADLLFTEADRSRQQLQDLKERNAGEKEILEASLKAKERETGELQMKIDEYEMRLSSNLQKIRVRERELENRLELAKVENSAVIRSKDESILDLKRQIDQMTVDIENFRSKGHELHRAVSDKQETLRRTVKALRLALSMLEGGPEEDESKKVK